MADLINIGTKQNAVDPDNPQTNEQVSATEFNEVVTKTNAAITQLNTIATGSVIKFVNTFVSLVANTNYDITVGSFGDNVRPWNISVEKSDGTSLISTIYPPQWFLDGSDYKIRLKSSQALSNVVVSWITVS